MKKLILLFTLCCCVLAFTACGEKPEEGSRLPEDPQNVVALSQSSAEEWTLAGGRLAGTTDDALEEMDLGKDVESVGTVSSPSIEAIVALEPDMVILTGDIPTHREVKKNLEENGIYCYTADINSLDQYLGVMKDFTDMTGREDLYRKNGTNVKEQVDEIKDEVEEEQGEPGQEDTYLLLKVSATRNKAIKGENFVCEILDGMGMNNIASEESYLEEISLEAVVKENPDYIFVTTMGMEEEAIGSFESQFRSKDAWAGLDAVKNDKVHILPKDLFQYKPNDKWGEAYEYIYKICRETDSK